MNIQEILKVNSPKDGVGGPYVVVNSKNYDGSSFAWAIVAMTWYESPVLGIRWFDENKGMPISSGYPVWFILPKELYNSLLSTLTISLKNKDLLNKFLLGEISGEELKEKWEY